VAGRCIPEVGNIQSAWRHASETCLKACIFPLEFQKGASTTVLKTALVLDEVDSWGLDIMDFIVGMVKGQSRPQTQSLTIVCHFPEAWERSSATKCV